MIGFGVGRGVGQGIDIFLITDWLYSTEEMA
jgi:hypothetical protein